MDPIATDVVPDLQIIKDFISIEEEAALLAFLNGSECTWRTDLARRVMHFGGQYCIMPARGSTLKPASVEAPPIPHQLAWLSQRFQEEGVLTGQKTAEYCIVNEYILAQGISPHVENYTFDEPVIGLSLGSPDVMRFHELNGRHDGSVRSGKSKLAPLTGQVVDVEIPGRSLMVMRGKARWEWQHEIRRVKGRRGRDFKRTSLTFRVKK